MRRTLLVLILLILSSCSSGELGPSSDAPRFPDDEGVVTAVTRRTLTLDEKRTLEISLDVQSFSSLEGHAPAPLLSWQNKFVHLGLADNKVVWVAGIGLALPEGRVVYVGVFDRIEQDRAVFKDGTALRFRAGLKPPKPGSQVVVTIDSAKREMTEFKAV